MMFKRVAKVVGTESQNLCKLPYEDIQIWNSKSVSPTLVFFSYLSFSVSLSSFSLSLLFLSLSLSLSTPPPSDSYHAAESI